MLEKEALQSARICRKLAHTLIEPMDSSITVLGNRALSSVLNFSVSELFVNPLGGRNYLLLLFSWKTITRGIF